MNRRKNILIIDDNPSQLNLFKAVAADLAAYLNFQFLHPAESKLTYPTTSHPKTLFILCNAKLMAFDAIELVSALRKLPEDQPAFTPVLLFGDGDDRELVKRSYSAHIDGFFPRPRTEDDAKTVLSLAIRYWSFALDSH